MENSASVVVLRSAHHGGLGIVRSLGRLRVPVYTVDPDLCTPAFGSRYCRGRFVMDIENGRCDESLARLLQIGKKLGNRPILIPTTDRTAIWVADHAGALQEAFRFPCQNPNLVRLLCDKSRMQGLASQCGVPIARSIVPRSRQDVLNFLESAAFPVMVKATDDERLRRRAGGTKFLIHNRRELLDLYARAGDSQNPNFLVQEFIPGEDWMFNGYFDRNSQCVFGAAGSKIRRFPVSTGVTSLGVCRRNETVEKITAEFMRAIGYQGILDIGYRYDLRDGQYKVLDVNPRIGCTFRLFVATSGMDVARALYLDLTGQPVIPAPVKDGRKWIVEDFDAFSSLACGREGKLTLKDWAKSLIGIEETACFALDDPLPLLLACLSDFRELYRWVHRRQGVRKENPAKLGEVACDF
jgi:D-aspartate ligase